MGTEPGGDPDKDVIGALDLDFPLPEPRPAPDFLVCK